VHLALYRSAAQPMKESGAYRPAGDYVARLYIIAPNDPFVRSEETSAEVADRLGATCHVLAGQGHWWMLGDPVARRRDAAGSWGLRVLVDLLTVTCPRLRR
ncbi:MAG: hypothetical protein IPL07_05470, partial [Acidimicrobiaceae bacterium]|nr:hypothetical protein [Acidimicrobiaceae bacterium]